MAFQHRNNEWKTGFFNHDENTDCGYSFIGDDMFLNVGVCVCARSDSQNRLLYVRLIEVDNRCVFNNKLVYSKTFLLIRMVIYITWFA